MTQYDDDLRSLLAEGRILERETEPPAEGGPADAAEPTDPTRPAEMHQQGDRRPGFIPGRRVRISTILNGNVRRSGTDENHSWTFNTKLPLWPRVWGRYISSAAAGATATSATAGSKVTPSAG